MYKFEDNIAIWQNFICFQMFLKIVNTYYRFVSIENINNNISILSLDPKNFSNERSDLLFVIKFIKPGHPLREKMCKDIKNTSKMWS